MPEKKSEISMGKGFKRIYFVIAGLWVAFLLFYYFSIFMACQIHKTDLIECIQWDPVWHWFTFSISAGLVVPIYYFLRWIIAGFKK